MRVNEPRESFDLTLTVKSTRNVRLGVRMKCFTGVSCKSTAFLGLS
jgi:hypothetical protein